MGSTITITIITGDQESVEIAPIDMRREHEVVDTEAAADAVEALWPTPMSDLGYFDHRARIDVWCANGEDAEAEATLREGLAAIREKYDAPNLSLPSDVEAELVCRRTQALEAWILQQPLYRATACVGNVDASQPEVLGDDLARVWASNEALQTTIDDQIDEIRDLFPGVEVGVEPLSEREAREWWTGRRDRIRA